MGPISDDAALGMSSIGQKDVAVTPLQNAMVAATIANGGLTMQPYLVEGLKGPDLANISTTAPSEVAAGSVIPGRDYTYGSDDWRRTGDSAEGSHRRRADCIQDRHGRTRYRSTQHPATRLVHRVRACQSPKVAVAVLIENGGDRLSATGGAVAAPIGRATIAAALREGS